MPDTATPMPAAKRPRRMAREPKSEKASSPAALTAVAPSKAPSKTTLVLDLLARPEGATIDQLVVATGWLPHTTRAALTGLKKKGHVIGSHKPADGPRVYRSASKAEAPS